MESFDAVIVGGGPAGSTCAWKLTRLGMRVLVLDRARFPRVKLCAGWVTPPVMRALQVDLKAYSSTRTLQPIDGFEVARQSDGDSTLVQYDSPVSFGIIRSEFDHFLLLRSGARVEDGVPSVEIERRNGTFRINDKFRTPLLIGAGGHFCPVARYLGAELKRESNISALELELKLKAEELGRFGVQPHIPLLVFCDDLRGYGWCFRKGSFVNIGIGRMENRGIRHHLRLLLHGLASRGHIPGENPFRIERFRGHAYKLHVLDPRRCFDRGVLLIGDSAGLAYNLSGEGIRPAVESALLAAETIREAEERYSAERLGSYQERLYRHFGKPWTGVRKWLAERFPPALFRRLGSTVLAHPPLTRRILIDYGFLRRDGRFEALSQGREVGRH